MVNAVSKAEIAEFLIERFDFMDKVEAKHYVDNFFELIIQSLSHAGQKMRNLIKDSLSNKPKALDDGATSSVEENN